MGSSVPQARARILATAVALPERTLDTSDLLAGVPEPSRALLVRHTGVDRRYIAAPDETALDLGERACRSLFGAHPGAAGRVDTLIFCTQSPDYVLPGNACVLHGRLGLPESVAAFDLPHACSAFVYALGLAHALIASGGAHDVLIVTAETYSRWIHPQDRSARVLFGDGAAATWVAAETDGRGVLDVQCGTAGQYYDRFYVPAGGSRRPASDDVRSQEARDTSGNIRTPAHIHMAGRDILSFVSSRVPDHVRAFLARGRRTTADVRWFVFHQASAVTLDSLVQRLELDEARVVRHLAPVGNTVCASIPMALDALVRRGDARDGDLLLLCGFGAGLSWGSALVRW
jgi:3-oxoacyl-[acyl-carrier-protein] synthase-3